MYVFCVDSNKQPLSMVPPCDARRLLKMQQAKVFRRHPFVIMVTDPSFVPDWCHGEFKIKIDPGSSTTGLVITRKNGDQEFVLYAAHIEHRRKSIVESMKSRLSLRRGRRGRKTRYRQARFLNRTRPKGWLPPSTQSVLSNIETIISKICRFCKITSVDIEQPKFDTQKHNKSDIKEKEYQEGPLKEHKTVRNYLLNCYRQCVYCGATGVRLERDHIVAKSSGGSDRLSNAVLACRSCNEKKGKQSVEDFLKNKPERLEQVLKLIQPNQSGMAVMNSIRHELPKRLASLGLKVVTYPPILTKENRDKFFEGKKDHWIDAACVGDILAMTNHVRKLVVFKAKGHGSRQRVNVDKYGLPRRSKETGKLQLHRIRKKKINGLQTGDKVHVVNHKSCKFGQVQFTGRVGSVRAKGSPTIVRNDGEKFAVLAKNLTIVHHNDGYEHSFREAFLMEVPVTLENKAEVLQASGK